MESNRQRFVIDLTTSEGRLDRFTSICHMLPSRGVSSIGALRGEIERELGLTNAKVVRRHLRAMETLGSLVRDEPGYALSKEGRVVRVLVPWRSRQARPLGTAEKVFYLRTLTVHVPLQLESMLLAISGVSSRDGQRCLADYARRLVKVGVPWKDADLIAQGLTRQPGPLPRKLRNNFDCLRLWMRQLGLVESEGLVLTPMGRWLAANMERPAERRETIYVAGSAYVCGSPGCLRTYDDRRDRWELTEMLRDAYSRFGTPGLGMASVVSIALYVCIQGVVRNRWVLSEDRFEMVLRSLARGGVVESLMTGRDGTLAYMSLGADDR
jgi:hypothetical protein